MKLYCGDCLELMREIPDGSVDMVLCDPPYGVTRNTWDNVIPFEPLWGGYWRVCKENAAVVLFSQMPFTADLVQSMRKYFRYEWIYQKTRTSGYLNANRMPLKTHENILVFYRKQPTYNPQWTFERPYKQMEHAQSDNYGKLERTATIHEDGRRFPKDVIRFSNAYWTGRTHPNEKPVGLMEYLIRTYTNEGEAVLDNCMGTGATGVACVQTGRDFIGMELDEGYFETAKRRIAEAERG